MSEFASFGLGGGSSGGFDGVVMAAVVLGGGRRRHHRESNNRLQRFVLSLSAVGATSGGCSGAVAATECDGAVGGEEVVLQALVKAGGGLGASVLASAVLAAAAVGYGCSWRQWLLALPAAGASGGHLMTACSGETLAGALLAAVAVGCRDSWRWRLLARSAAGASGRRLMVASFWPQWEAAAALVGGCWRWPALATVGGVFGGVAVAATVVGGSWRQLQLGRGGRLRCPLLPLSVVVAAGCGFEIGVVAAAEIGWPSLSA